MLATKVTKDEFKKVPSFWIDVAPFPNPGRSFASLITNSGGIRMSFSRKYPDVKTAVRVFPLAPSETWTATRCPVRNETPKLPTHFLLAGKTLRSVAGANCSLMSVKVAMRTWFGLSAEYRVTIKYANNPSFDCI